MVVLAEDCGVRTVSPQQFHNHDVISLFLAEFLSLFKLNIFSSKIEILEKH